MSAGAPPERPPDEPAQLQSGWRGIEVERELPALRLLYSEVHVARRGSLTGGSPADVHERLRALSSRFRGARAVQLRSEPVTAAYRVFFRHIGLDPDAVRTPMEEAVLERMLRGGFLSGGLLADVLLIALLDTSVPVWALDAEAVSGPLGVRASRDAEPLGRARHAPALPAGRLVVADAEGPLALLFGEPAEGHCARGGSRRLTLFAVQVAGVPALHAEESLWNARMALETAD